MKLIEAVSAVAVILFAVSMGYPKMTSGKEKTVIEVKRLEKDLAISDLDAAAWKRASAVTVDNYWSGKKAPAGRSFTAKLLWSDTALYVRFEANQAEPLVVSPTPDLSRKTRGLWDRDVCEIFIAPDRSTPQKYFEFEIAPTGEWIDLAIQVTPEKRITDWEYSSGMESAAKIETGRVVMAIKVPWKALGRTPERGDVWLGNLLRCVGAGDERGYLAWRPTKTESPNFHVPEKFGEFVFAG